MKPLLFRLKPETAHDLAAAVLSRSWLCPLLGNAKVPTGEEAFLATRFCGKTLPHPIGLAAGFDKNAAMFPNLHRLGFSFAEVGTVTAKSQPGNPKPRLFRLPKDQALINRMGFNNGGADLAAEHLSQSKAKIPIGANIGKSKITPLEGANEDYAYSFQRLKPHVDYFVVNVSSPNTPDLRKLQAKEPLLALLQELNAMNADPRRPLLLKIAPDLTDGQLQEIVEVAVETGIDGIIATNTTIERKALHTVPSQLERIGAGGLSGSPLAQRSTAIIHFLRKHLPEHIRITGVGGIFSGKDAFEKIAAGADNLQIYTSLVYRGPRTVPYILQELAIVLKQKGFKNLTEAIGSGLPS